jgi:hypothetical protein
MVVALNENWKVPVGYFLIKSLRAQERADIINRSLTRLQDTGAKCHSITFDGASVNTGVPELADQIETVWNLMVMKVKNV